MFRTHVAIGLLVGLITAKFLNPGIEWLFVMIVAFSSSFPDIDHPRSRISKLFFPVSWVISWVVSHRGIFHSIFPVIGFYLIFSYLGLKYLGFAVALGYLSHLVADAMTYGGIDFLYPISRFKISGPIVVGGFFEYLIFILVVILDVLIIVKQNFINVF